MAASHVDQTTIQRNSSDMDNHGILTEIHEKNATIDDMLRVIDQMFDGDNKADDAASPIILKQEEVLQPQNQNDGVGMISNTDPLATSSKTITKSSWCLRQGIKNLIVADYYYHHTNLEQNKKEKKETNRKVKTESSDIYTNVTANLKLLLLFDYVQQNGLPTFYSLWDHYPNDKIRRKRHDATQDIKDPETTFESLCRIVIGQMVSVKGAQAIWIRFNDHVSQYYQKYYQEVDSRNHKPQNSKKRKKDHGQQTVLQPNEKNISPVATDLDNIISDQSLAERAKTSNRKVTITPQLILDVVRQTHVQSQSSSRKRKKKNEVNDISIEDNMIEENFQKPVGLTKNKAKSIIDLSLRYVNGTLSDDFLLSCSNDDTTIRNALLQVKGIGPWSCDMFMMFHLERSNILPLQDLGVQKGLQHYFGFHNLTKNGTNPKKKKNHERPKIKTDPNDWIREQLKCYEPYHSLLSYYMWRVAEDKSSSTKPT